MGSHLPVPTTLGEHQKPTGGEILVPAYRQFLRRRRPLKCTRRFNYIYKQHALERKVLFDQTSNRRHHLFFQQNNNF